MKSNASHFRWVYHLKSPIGGIDRGIALGLTRFVDLPRNWDFIPISLGRLFDRQLKPEYKSCWKHVKKAGKNSFRLGRCPVHKRVRLEIDGR